MSGWVRVNPSGILGWFGSMLRWLMIGLLVSLGALLIAAAGAARHILLQRRRHRMEAAVAADARGVSEADRAEQDREP